MILRGLRPSPGSFPTAVVHPPRGSQRGHLTAQIWSRCSLLRTLQRLPRARSLQPTFLSIACRILCKLAPVLFSTNFPKRYQTSDPVPPKRHAVLTKDRLTALSASAQALTDLFPLAGAVCVSWGGGWGIVRVQYNLQNGRFSFRIFSVSLSISYTPLLVQTPQHPSADSSIIPH